MNPTFPDLVRYGCWGLLGILALITYINTRYPEQREIFKTILKWSFILWMVAGVVFLFSSTPITFTEWLGGGAFVFLGGGCAIYNIIAWLMLAGERMDKWALHPPVVETVDGIVEEPAEDVPQLQASNSSSLRRKGGDR